MKNILYIIVILLVAAAISAGTYALVENNGDSASMQGGTPPNMTNTEGMPARPEGEHHEGGGHGTSFAGGLSGVFVTLGKLTAITVVIALLQKGFDLLSAMNLKTIQN